MGIHRFAILCLVALFAMGYPHEVAAEDAHTRIAVVSSYHPNYLWSQETNAGLIAALLEFRYLDNEDQGEQYTRDDYVESSRAVIKKWWMDTKRKSSRDEIKRAVERIVIDLERFRPDILLLGDDNAANHIANQYIDTELPVVFWGVNGTPLKYGLLDSIDRPGHNVTGIYQAGYLKEGIIALKALIPYIKTMAVLSDNSPTGRAKVKELERYARKDQLPVRIVETVVTNSVDTWKAKALELQHQVDAFFVLNHNTLKDATERPIDQLEVGAWYLRHINKPDISHEKQFVIEGMLCAVDDSGFKQGFEAVKVAHRILDNGEDPALIAAHAPARGPFIINLQRAEMLGIREAIESSPLVEARVDKAMALEKYLPNR